MFSKQTAAAVAVAAGQNLHDTLIAHGADHPDTQQAANDAETAMDAAKAAGCTPADYQAARNRG
uniref:hypothetical protein n=1 Tax=Streptomyces sp. CA-141956 TaxID=3240051 RepID=UPI003F493C94